MKRWTPCLLLLCLAGLGLAAAQAQTTAAPQAPHLILATYRYDYQADRRKSVPLLNSRDEQGRSMLTQHPYWGSGPWFSYDRAQWHKQHLTEMRDVGIDVAVVLFNGSAKARASHSIKGLDALVQALTEFRAEEERPFTRGRVYPRLALGLDLRGLREQYGAPPDLSQRETQQSFYGMIREFFLRVPPQFRATVVLPAERRRPPEPTPGMASPGAAHIVRLMYGEAVRNPGDAALAYCEQRFAQEFGARLVWIGTPDLGAKMSRLDAVVPYPAAMGPATVSSGSWLSIAAFGPGYDSRQPDQPLRPRGLVTFDEDFLKMTEARPRWLLVDSWNDLTNGSNIGPSLELGPFYSDLLRGKTPLFRDRTEYAANFLDARVPAVVDPQTAYRVEVAVQNSGIEIWGANQQVQLGYVWLKDGEIVGVSGPGPITTIQRPGETRNMLVRLQALDLDDSQPLPLPPGEYELEFRMARSQGGTTAVWFDAEDGTPYRVPVRVGKPEKLIASWKGSNMPRMVAAGLTYEAKITLRNDGSETWWGVPPDKKKAKQAARRQATNGGKPKGRRNGNGRRADKAEKLAKGGKDKAEKRGAPYSVAYRWRRVSTFLHGFATDSDEIVAEGKRVQLPQDVPPGSQIALDMKVPTMDKQGRPLPLWSPEANWSYVLEWDLHDGRKWLSQQGGVTYREPIEVLDRDPSPYFIGCNLLNQLVAGREEKITLGIRNTGPSTWVPGRDKILVHWFYLDGTEASWMDSTLELPKEQKFTATQSLKILSIGPYSELDLEVPKVGRVRRRGGRKKNGKKEPGRNGAKAAGRGSSAPKRKGEKPLIPVKIRQDLVLRNVPVKVPYYFGPMYVVFDLLHDGKPASTSGVTKGNDILVIPVDILSPTFTPVQLGAHYNVDGISQNVDRNDGNLDGRGNTLPSEYLPPFVARPGFRGLVQFMPMYPCGIWTRRLNDINFDRVNFLWPRKTNQALNMVACDGQVVRFSAYGRTGLHLLAVCTDADVTATFTLTYTDGEQVTQEVEFTHWNEPPKHGEHPAFVAPHRHTRLGDDPATKCYINHYPLKTKPLKKLASVTFPKNPAIKVLAVTLESSSIELRTR